MSNVVNQNAAAPATLDSLISSADVQMQFKKMLGQKSAVFLTSLLSQVNNNKMLQSVEPRSILAAASTAASLDLPVNQSLGKAWIVPYGRVAQFQLGYKGLIELAQRSGKMKFITMVPVCEGEIKSWNKFTESLTYGEKTGDNVVGYFASFELLNGFKKSTYWTKDEVYNHAKRFSKAFNSGPWQTDFDAMACKTVLSSILRTYAPLSIEMQQAMEADGRAAVMNDRGENEYVDVDIEASGEPTPVEVPIAPSAQGVEQPAAVSRPSWLKK